MNVWGIVKITLSVDVTGILETSLRYNRKFGNHNVGGLFLYNQTKSILS